MGAPEPNNGQLPRRGGLIWHRDFRLLWAGETISHFGSQVSVLVLPLVAVLYLHASTFEVGVLTALESVRRRSGTRHRDGRLRCFLPELSPRLGRAQRAHGRKCQAGGGQSVAEVSGPTLGGFLVELFTAPFAVMADAISFLGSAIFLGMIGRSEASPERSERRHLVGEIGEGLGFVLRHPILRMIAATTGTANFFSSAVAAVIVVFLVRSVDLSAGGIGVLMSAGGIGGILGAFTASAIATRIGQARTIWLSVMTTAPFGLLIPFTERGAGLAFYVAGILPVSFGVAVHNVARVSFRQALCPARLLGRMNATMRFLVWGTTPLGALLGGALGTWIGLRPTLWASQVGEVLAAGRVIASPLRTMRDFPAQNTADARWRLPAGASGKPCR